LPNAEPPYAYGLQANALRPPEAARDFRRGNPSTLHATVGPVPLPEPRTRDRFSPNRDPERAGDQLRNLRAPHPSIDPETLSDLPL